MALNFSHRPVFPGCLTEDNLVTPMRIGNGFRVEGISEKSGGDGFGNGWHDVENCFDYGRDKCDRGSTQDSVSKDNILDLLPSDPFGMDMSTRITAITGWLEDLEADYGGYSSDTAATNGDYQLFAGLNFIWNSAMKFRTFPGGNVCVEKGKSQGPSSCGEFSQREVGSSSCNFDFGSACNNVCVEPSSYGECSQREVGSSSCNFDFGSACNNVCVERGKSQGPSSCGECSQKEVGSSSCNFDFGSTCNTDDALGVDSDYTDVAIASESPSVSGDTRMDDVNLLEGDDVNLLEGDDVNLLEGDDVNLLEGDEFAPHPPLNMDDVNLLEGDEFAPHPAFNYSLSYLGLSDLLVVERVCKSLHYTVRHDPLLWINVHIDQPLNERITDDVLLRLTNRAQGNLQCLRLVECTRITDDGLKRVLEVNPKLVKLSVPGCTRLSIEGIVAILKAYNSVGTQGVKHLHIGGLYGVTQKHFEELKLLLGADSQLEHSHKPHFYRRGNLYLSCDDDRAIDIEVCPRCQNLRLVYDCPAEGCQGMGHTAQVCRACTLCILRCSQCGRCINDSEYEETFCLEWLCSSCSRQLVRSSERMDGEVEPATPVVFHEQS